MKNLPSFKARDRQRKDICISHTLISASVWYYLINVSRISKDTDSRLKWNLPGFLQLGFLLSIPCVYIFPNLSLRLCSMNIPASRLSPSLCLQFSSRAAQARGDGAGGSIRQCHDLLQRHRGLHIHVCREYTATGALQSICHSNPPMNNSHSKLAASICVLLVLWWNK